MRITLVPMIAMFVATALHIPLCFLFVNGFDMDIRGLALASSIKDIILLATVMIYGNCSKEISPMLHYPDSESLRGWGEYLNGDGWTQVADLISIANAMLASKGG